MLFDLRYLENSSRLLSNRRSFLCHHPLVDESNLYNISWILKSSTNRDIKKKKFEFLSRPVSVIGVKSSTRIATLGWDRIDFIPRPENQPSGANPRD